MDILKAKRIEAGAQVTLFLLLFVSALVEATPVLPFILLGIWQTCSFFFYPSAVSDSQ